MSLLIKNVILEGKKRDIFVEGSKIKKIGPSLNLRAKEKIDGKGKKAVLPGLINCHTHAAMVLFRGYGEGLPLKQWLEQKIWPAEAKLTPDDIYWGTKLACLEMIRTGTTCFSDMYWFEEAAVQAVSEMGIRAKIGLVLLDFLSLGRREVFLKCWRALSKRKLERISLSVAPHSIYTVCRENLIWAKNFAQRNDLIIHTHISETEREVKDCQKKWKMRPVEYLERIGFLGENVVLAHGVWLSDKEIGILSKKKCSLVYNPCSNLKLGSGIMPYKKLQESGVRVCLGTDGPASNNNLDMFEEMKVGALIQKGCSAQDIFNSATCHGAQALKINAGKIQTGRLADLVLVDLDQTFFLPGHDLISDVVYSASGLVVSDTICDGKILMRDGQIKNETKIIHKTKTIKHYYTM